MDSTAFTEFDQNIVHTVLVKFLLSLLPWFSKINGGAKESHCNLQDERNQTRKVFWIRFILRNPESK